MPQSTGAEDTVLLRVEGLSRSFGGLKALDQVSFQVRRGSVVGIIGPNGSGKTTLFNLISGFLRPSAGRVLLNRRDITGWPPHRIANAGLARTFQLVQPFVGMTVREALKLPCNSPRARAHGGAGHGDEYVERLARDLGLTRLDARVDDLNHGEARLLDIARAVATRPDILLLDEPFASLSHQEIEMVSRVVRRLREQGTTLVIVEHRLRALMKLVDEVMVLNFGRKIAEGSPAEVVRNPEVVSAYLGKTGGDLLHAAAPNP